MGVRARGSIIIGLFGVSLCLVGCLFPSFDGMAGGDDDSGKSSGGDNNKNGATTKPSGQVTDQQSSAQTTDGGSSSSGGNTQGGASGAEHPSANKILGCGSSTCDTKSQYCCPSFGDAECNSNSDPGFCQAWVRCDGPEDCGEGMQCCASFNEAKCAKDCGGGLRIVCHPSTTPGAPDGCPGTMKCTGVTQVNEAFSGHFCQ